MFNYLFPIETINRELDAKLMLAVNVVNETSEVYLGQHDYMHRLVSRMRHGVYFGKNCSRRTRHDSLRIVNLLKSRDFRIFYLHEEGAIFGSDEDALRGMLAKQYDPTLFCSEDAIFVWGDVQREFDISRLGGHKVSVEAVGHPRFDLYKEKYRKYFQRAVDAIRSRYGRYILLNTNFAIINNRMRPWEEFLRRDGRERLFVQVGQEFFRFVDLAIVLATKLPDVRIVLRSHPSEHDGPYAELFKKYPNVVVKHDGPVAPWIFGAECLVHAGCTTAVEAWFADVPSLDYSLVSNSPLTSETSRRCTSAEDVVHELREILSKRMKGTQRAQPSEQSRRILRNIDADAMETLTNHLRRANDGEGEGATPAHLWAKRGSDWVRQRAASAKARVSHDSHARRTYHIRKFQGFDESTIRGSIAAANGILGRAAVVKHFDPMLVVIGASG